MRPHASRERSARAEAPDVSLSLLPTVDWEQSPLYLYPHQSQNEPPAEVTKALMLRGKRQKRAGHLCQCNCPLLVGPLLEVVPSVVVGSKSFIQTRQFVQSTMGSVTRATLGKRSFHREIDCGERGTSLQFTA